jgi:hypothetical protein
LLLKFQGDPTPPKCQTRGHGTGYIM